MKVIVFFTVMLTILTSTFAQSDDMTVTKSFLIVKSTKSYQSALKTANSVSEKFKYQLKLNGNIEDKENGLTSLDTCDCGEQHGYVPRGRYDDGIYVSIEYSSYFEGFSPGYYIVVVASGANNKLISTLNQVVLEYDDAYIKTALVYMGCMH
ncbi:MAG: hypothetical protein AB8B74_08510 [Crocinitomicaceae bacterium]